jgi:hypothetical protein
MTTKSDRQLLIEATAKKLNIPEAMLKGINIPENENVDVFLFEYSEAIKAARGDKTPIIGKPSIEGNKQEMEFADNLLNKWGVDSSAKIGETYSQLNQRKQAESQQK